MQLFLAVSRPYSSPNDYRSRLRTTLAGNYCRHRDTSRKFLPKTAISLARPAKKSLGSHIQTARADVYRAAKLNPTVVYDIFAGKSRPGRDNALMLAFGMRCDLKETQRLLRLAGVSELWPKVRRDAIVIWCVEHGMTLNECDEGLWRLGEKTLFDSER